jgi:hypothetical protein
MQKQVALVTPSHRKDIERFAVLCDSVDRHVSGYERHYVIVNDDDMPYFARFGGAHRTVLPCSALLPRWLRLVPPWLLRNGRRVWWSFRSRPVHGWHIQQIVKIAAALQLPEQRFCLIDSDNVFIRRFDVGEYAGGERTPLYVDPASIAADKPLHAKWTRNCRRLLGKPDAAAFPADDYIGNAIVWDKLALRDMTHAIERVAGTGWVQALCRTRAFSEYLLYGHFVRNSPLHASKHAITTQSLASAYWGEAPLGAAAVAALVRDAPEPKVALCIESYSNTPVSIIRNAVNLPQRDPAPAPLLRATAGAGARRAGTIDRAVSVER